MSAMKHRNRGGHGNGDYEKFILMALLKGGPLSLPELQEKFLVLTSQFSLSHQAFEEWAQGKGDRVHRVLARFGHEVEKKDWHLKRQEERRDEDVRPLDADTLRECETLLQKGLIRVAEDQKYELTEAGTAAARGYAQEIERGAHVLKEQFLSPSAAARNTMIIDFFLAAMKFLAGFLSGSVGLIADGADAAIDTASAAVVWLGIKYKKELLGTVIIILMMFVTASSVGYESIVTLYAVITVTARLLMRPYLVIAVEGVALVAAALLGLYQRLVGKRYGSLALISQSIDSRNHIYVAAAVILGAIFSIFGIHVVDALIGVYIAVRIVKDGLGLTGEVISTMKGEATDFSRYRTPLDRLYEKHRLESFRNWLLYAVKEEQVRTKEQLIRSLEKAFKPEYVPILSEFEFSLGEGVDLAALFESLVDPLVEQNLLRRKGDRFELTREGEKRIDGVLWYIRFHRSN